MGLVVKAWSLNLLSSAGCAFRVPADIQEPFHSVPPKHCLDRVAEFAPLVLRKRERADIRHSLSCPRSVTQMLKLLTGLAKLIGPYDVQLRRSVWPC